MSETLNFPMQCAEQKTKNGRGRKKKGKNPQLLGTKREKAPAPRAVAAALLRSASVQGVKCNIRSKVFIIIVITIIMKNTVMYLFSSKNKLIHSLQFDINIVDLTCIYSSPPPPHTSLLIYSVSAGSIRVLLSQYTLSKLFYLFNLF